MQNGGGFRLALRGEKWSRRCGLQVCEVWSALPGFWPVSHRANGPIGHIGRFQNV